MQPDIPSGGDVWWRDHRRIYNRWLVGAGLIAFACYCTVVWTGCPDVDEFEITAFTVFIQACGYLVAMAIANICYFMGPISERIFKPANSDRYRKITFGLGVAFSVALPMLVPLMAFFTVPRC